MSNILYLFNPWWERESFFTGVPRTKYLSQIKQNLTNKQAIMLVGSRRVGKTTLIYQIIKHLLNQNVAAPQIIYLPLDHPSMQGRKILEIIEEIRTLHQHRRKIKLFLFLDEVQRFPDWEKEAKALVDFENIKMFVSGSVSSLILAKGSFLTGRTLTFTINPFDLKEYVDFEGAPSKTDTAYLDGMLVEFLKTGGYPEYVMNKNPLYFSDLVESVIFKDISTLFSVKNTGLLLQLLALLADRVSSQTSFTKLGKIIELTKDTVRDYIYYLTSTFLVGELKRFSLSRHASLYSPKKFYLLDTGLLFNLTGKLNLGAACENLVWQKFSQSPKKLGFYYEEQREIDFLNAEGEAYEVKYDLSTDGWEKLQKVIKNISPKLAKKFTILTKTPRGKTTINNLPIQFLKLSEFLYYG